MKYIEVVRRLEVWGFRPLGLTRMYSGRQAHFVFGEPNFSARYARFTVASNWHGASLYAYVPYAHGEETLPQQYEPFTDGWYVDPERELIARIDDLRIEGGKRREAERLCDELAKFYPGSIVGIARRKLDSTFAFVRDVYIPRHIVREQEVHDGIPVRVVRWEETEKGKRAIEIQLLRLPYMPTSHGEDWSWSQTHSLPGDWVAQLYEQVPGFHASIYQWTHFVFDEPGKPPQLVKAIETAPLWYVGDETSNVVVTETYQQDFEGPETDAPLSWYTPVWSETYTRQHNGYTTAPQGREPDAIGVRLRNSETIFLVALKSDPERSSRMVWSYVERDAAARLRR